MPVLPWGRNFYPHTYPIPMGISMGIPTPTADLLYAHYGICMGLPTS